MLLVHVDSDREYLRAPGDELETDLGVLTVPDDPPPDPGDRLETHLGEPFVVTPLYGPDLFDHMERTGAPMLPRDVGLVLGEAGPAAGDRALDAGTGTGVLAAYLGRLGLSVVTYERDPEFADVARENLRLAGVYEAVSVRTGDVREDLDSLSDTRFDLVTLDTADAVDVVDRTPDLLARGGTVAVYSPFVEDARAANEAASEAGLSEVRTVETIQREMAFDDRGSRPQTGPVGHTGYLTVGRR